MSDFDIDRFPTSETAKRMLSRVSPVYQQAYVAKWLYQVMGIELDDVKARFEELRYQRFVDTVTWGIEYLENKYSIVPDDSLTIEQRRARLRSRKFKKYPLNPGMLEKRIMDLWSVSCDVDETYSSGIVLLAFDNGSKDIVDIIKDFKKVKPSHLSCRIEIHSSEALNIYTGAIVQLQSTRHLMAAPLPDTIMQRLYIGLGQRFGGQQSVRVTVPEREQMDIAVGLRLGYHGLHKVNAEYTEPPTIQNMLVDMPVITGAFLLRGGQQSIHIRMPTGETTGYNTGLAMRRSGVTSIAPAMHATVDSPLMVGCFLRGAIAGKIACRKEDM